MLRSLPHNLVVKRLPENLRRRIARRVRAAIEQPALASRIQLIYPAPLSRLPRLTFDLPENLERNLQAIARQDLS